MKKLLMIDMDDVITDGTFRLQIENFIGHKIDTNKTGYYLQNALEDKKEDFFKKGPLNMYDKAILKENAYDVIYALNQKYDLYIVSSYSIFDAPYQEGNHLKYKLEFLQEKLPFLETRQIMFMSEKKLIHWDVAIDDSLRHLENADLKLLYTAYHNENISLEELNNKNIIRVDNWLDIKKLLLEESHGKIAKSNSK